MILVDSSPLVPAARSTIRTTRCTELLGSATEELLMPVEARDVGGTSPLQRSIKPAFGRVLAHRDTGPAEAL